MWLCRDQKLQACKDVSCQFGASSLSSMLTLTTAAGLSSVRAFPICKNNELEQRRCQRKTFNKGTCTHRGLRLVFFIASYEPVPEDHIQSVLNLWSWDELHNLDKQGFFSWGHQHGMDLHTGLGQGQTIDFVLTWKFDSLLESLCITKRMTGKSLVDE